MNGLNPPSSKTPAPPGQARWRRWVCWGRRQTRSTPRNTSAPNTSGPNASAPGLAGWGSRPNGASVWVGPPASITQACAPTLKSCATRAICRPKIAPTSGAASRRLSARRWRSGRTGASRTRPGGPRPLRQRSRGFSDAADLVLPTVPPVAFQMTHPAPESLGR